MSIAELLGDGQVEVAGVGTAKAALEAIQARRFDCAVVDLGLPDLPGAELIEQHPHDGGGGELPIVVYTGQDLDQGGGAPARRIASTVIVKGTGSSERLLDETALFLHRAIAGDPGGQADHRRPPGATVRSRAARCSSSTTTCATSSR